jgi:hypothetical protein
MMSMLFSYEGTQTHKQWHLRGTKKEGLIDGGIMGFLDLDRQTQRKRVNFLKEIETL